MATDIDAFTPLRSWIIAHSDLTEVILGFGGGDRPTKPYGMLNLIGLDKDNEPVDKLYDVVTGVPDGYCRHR